jgi:hypothetical protein
MGWWSQHVGWWDLQLANRAFDLIVKIAAILAAVAAINLLGPKPHLVATPTCHVSLDMSVVAGRYKQAGRVTPGWLIDAVRSLNRPAGLVRVTGSGASVNGPAGSFRVTGSGASVRTLTPRVLFTIKSGSLAMSSQEPLARRSRCTSLTVSRGSLDGVLRLDRRLPGTLAVPHVLAPFEAARLRYVRPALGASLVAFLTRAARSGELRVVADRELRFHTAVAPVHDLALARTVVAAATTIRADVSVENRGGWRN